MKKEEIISAFTEFNNEAQELFELSYIKKLQDSGFTISRERGKPIKTEYRGPDDEAMKAFGNDLRKFRQKNDTLRIEKLTRYYKSGHVNAQRRKKFGEIMSEYDKIRKASSGFNIEGKEYTNEDLAAVFLYGKVSHRTKGTKRTYDKWKANPVSFLLKKNTFLRITHAYVLVINNIFYLNKLVMKDLSES